MRYKKGLATVLTISILLIIFVFAVYNKKPLEIKYSRILMGTVVELTLIGSNEGQLEKAAEAAFTEIKRLEGLTSHYIEDSDIARINNGAGKEAVQVSYEALEVIDASLKASQMTNGAFDITMGILGKAWHFTKDDKGELTPPSEEEIKKLLPLIDYRQIMLDKQNNTIKLTKQRMRINLGGIAKGYIIGKAAEALKKNGVKNGIVHAGGDMVVFNEADSLPWLIGIQDPRNKDKIIGTLKVANTAVATSGDYERFFIKDGKRYHHIMDLSTGFPANKSMAVTIVTDAPMMADAISTAVFVMGPDKGMKLIEEQPDVEGLIIGTDGKITMSSGFRKIYTPDTK